MKIKLTILLTIISLSTFAKTEQVLDTITVWKVYIGTTLVKDFNDFTKDKRIILKKGNVKVVDTLKIVYFDDTPCPNCKSELIIKTETGKIVKRIFGKYKFEIGTVEIQLISFNNRSEILKFYYKEDENYREKLLFETKIQ